MTDWYSNSSSVGTQLDLWTVKQEDGEPVREFAERVAQLAFRAARTTHPDWTRSRQQQEADTNAAEVFVRGLRGSLKMQVAGREPATLMEALKVARRFEELATRSTPDEDELWKVNAVQTGRAGDPRRCFQCGELGHIANQCMRRDAPNLHPIQASGGRRAEEPRVRPRMPCCLCQSWQHFPVNCPVFWKAATLCDLCGRSDHVTERCAWRDQLATCIRSWKGASAAGALPWTTAPTGGWRRTMGREEPSTGASAVAHLTTLREQEESEIPPREPVITTPPESEGPEYYVPAAAVAERRAVRVPVSLNGQKIEMLVDTGAQVSVLTQPIAGVPILPCRGRVIAADGHPLKIRGVQELTVGIADQQLQHPFLILDQPGGIDLVGLDLLERTPLGLNFRTAQLIKIESPQEWICGGVKDPEPSEDDESMEEEKLPDEGWGGAEEDPGRQLDEKLTHLMSTTEHRLEERLKAQEEARRITRMELERACRKRTEMANRRRNPRYLSPGQRVYIRQMPGIPKKFWCPWVGPVTVLRRLSEVTYEIEDLVGRKQIVHSGRLKPTGERGVEDDSYQPPQDPWVGSKRKELQPGKTWAQLKRTWRKTSQQG